jgi:peptidoglycan hydrolase-like protein with peptidoglycan-binding domain
MPGHQIHLPPGEQPTTTRLKQGQSPGVSDILGPSSCAGCFNGTESAGAQASVQELQVLLVGLGLLQASASTTGFYGNDTYQAVLSFQKQAHPGTSSEWDGRVGKTTRASIKTAYDTLNRMRAAENGSAPAGSSPAPALTTAAIQAGGDKIYDKPWFWPAILSTAVVAGGLIYWRTRA